MAFIADEKIEEIRQRADIVEIISSHTQLKRAGRSYVGLCPFHQEKSPSFTVNPERQVFYCFGCHKGGEVVRFVMDVQGISFPEALRFLADKYGIELVFDGKEPANRGMREIIFDLNGKAAAFFHKRLLDEQSGKIAREYLEKRGVSKDMASKFGLGWAPDSWDSLLNELRRASVDLEKAAQAGLIVKKQGSGYYDRFRGRLMFPIRNSASKTIGFSGRVLVGDDMAKYINSTESEVFNKSNSFYGIDLAIDSIRKTARVILCEGNLDVIMLHQHGFTDSMASLGTALTESHVRRLARTADNILLVFDGDEAGQKAMRRALELFLPADVQPRCVVLPDGHDPDSFLRKEGAEAFASLINSAPTLIEFAVSRAFKAQDAGNEGRSKAVAELLPILAQVGDLVLRDLWIKSVAERAGVREETVRKQIQTLRRPKPYAAGPSRVEEKKAVDRGRLNPEQGLLRLLMNYPRLAVRFAEEKTAKRFKDPLLSELADIITEKALESQSDEDFRLADIVGHIQDTSLQEAVAGWAVDDGGIGDREASMAYEDYSRKIAIADLRDQLGEIDRRIRETRQSSDQAEGLPEMLKERHKIITLLDSAKASD